MSIQKKNNKYYACVYAGYLNGKRIYEWSEGFEDKKLARLEEAKLIEMIISKGGISKKKNSFSEVAETWLDMREKTVAYSTYRGNKSYYEMYIRDYFKGKHIKKIEPLEIQQFMLSLEVGPATINKTMNILSLIFDFAVTMKMVYHNPCKGIKKPKIPKSKHVTWGEDTISKFLSAECVTKSKVYAALVILFTTGMRPGEVCGLRWGDFKEDHFTPTIGINRYGTETDLKNDKAHESVFVPDFFIPYLKRFKTAQKTIFFSKGHKLNNKSFINCLEPDMRPMTPEYLSDKFTELVEKTKLPKITLYEARHSFGTNMMKNGVNPKKVAELMRHTTVRTTLDNYSHVNDEMKKKEINKYSIKIPI